MTRQRKTDEAKLREGQGTGHGIHYKPWIKVHEFGTCGRSHRHCGWMHGRIYQFLSDLEFYYFLLMQWEDSVIDIREQYPLLPLDQTILIAKDLGILHQPKNSKEKIVLTTDFMLTVKAGTETKSVARTIKPDAHLDKSRTIEKFMIEQAYWKLKGVDWGIVTEAQISRTMARNIYSIYNDYFWADDSGYDENDIVEAGLRFQERLN